MYEITDPKEYKKLKAKRKSQSNTKKNLDNCTEARLNTREQSALYKLKKLKREMEPNDK